MKTYYTFFLFTFIYFFFRASSYCQVATFEEISLSPGSYWNGSDLTNGFHNGPAYFINRYNTAYYSWTGFSCSNMTDITTAGWINQYSAYAGSGVNQSSNYAVAYGTDTIVFDNPMQISGIYLTNGTYPALSMLTGDAYAKKFGGTTGNDPDWFKITFTGIDPEGNITDSIEFFLADFRFENNAMDYVVNTWEWVDFSSLGTVKKITFELSSSDNGAWGMNTPAYFCMDDLNGSGSSVSGICSVEEIKLYPNPASDIIYFDTRNISDYHIKDISGRILKTGRIEAYQQSLSVSDLPSGLYILSAETASGILISRFVKK